MDMRMNFELLTPCVQHAEEANFRTEVPRIARDFLKCFGTSAKQEIVEDLLVLQHQWPQPVGQCDDDLQVPGRQQFSPPPRNPPFPSPDLPLPPPPIPPPSSSDVPLPAPLPFPA